MKDDIVKTKLEYFDKRSQYIVLNKKGLVQDSCDSLFLTPRDTSLFQLIPFLEGMESTLTVLESGKDLRFLCIKTSLMDREGYFNFIFKKQEQGQILWFIYDFTEFYTFLLPWQQERNERSIESELLLIQQKSAEMEKQLLQYQNEELKRIQEMKTVFFSQVSHEIRTPLHSLIGLINLIEPHGNAENRSYLSALRSVSDHLASIINDVLDLSKLDSGEIRLQKEVFALDKTIKKLMQAFMYQTQEKGIGLGYELDASLPDYLQGDTIRLSQILYNLLGNAIKFTSKGEVSLHIKALEQTAKKVLLRFEVVDSGIGISEAGMKKIFTPFVQASEDIHRYYGGTGLGLSIVQKLVDLFGGTLEVKSKVNSGTRVTVTLPFAVGNKVSDSSAKSEDHTKFTLSHIHKVLIGEDDLMNQKVLSQLLKRWNIATTVKSDGKEVLHTLSEDKLYDLVILDYQMPEMNGVEVLQQLKEQECNIPVIILSGNLLKEQKIPHRNAGLTFMLHKPVQAVDLMQKLEKIDRFMGPALDLHYMHQITDGDLELMCDLINTFIEQAPLALKKIRLAWEQKDYAALQHAVHKAKPGFQCVGSAEVNQLLDHFEEEVEEKKQEEGYEETIQLIEQWVGRVMHSMKHERKELFKQEL